MKLKFLLLLGFFCLLSNTNFGQKQVSAPVKEEKIYLEFSVPAGFYEEGQVLSLSAPGADIYYTLDGATPNRSAEKYRKPILIRETTVVRAVAYKGERKSKIKGYTYFIDEAPTHLPVVSLGITPAVLFDAQTGLYMQGPDAIDSLWKKEGANFWSRREVNINTEIFESNGKLEFQSITGFRLFGGMSRLFPQKSMTLVARDGYGKKRFRHKIFGKEGFKKYKFLVLRNSGSDWGKSHIRDGLMTGLVEDWDLEKQNFRPAHVYLNGKYWGIYNIREKINRYFVEAHSGVDKDSIDLMEHRWGLKRGSRKHYLKMLKFIKENDLSDSKNFNYLNSQMDIENFMDYQIAQIYFDNKDAGGNIKYWRPQTPSGRWRWILYDTDWGFGLHDAKAYNNNSLSFFTAPNGPTWPNPPWSTLILRKLLENKKFREAFIVRFSDRLNTSFQQDTVLHKIDELYSQIQPEMPRHLKRWRLSEKRWNKHIERLKAFAEKRVKYIRFHLSEKFETGDLVSVSIYGSPGGKVILNNNVVLREKDFTGLYFENYPLQLKAIPDFGYRFSHWEGLHKNMGKNETFVSLQGKSIHKLKAVFEKYEHPLAGSVLINEVSANDKKANDWVEIYNDSDKKVDLTGWFFTDKKHYYNLPSASIDAKSYLIVARDTQAFKNVFPQVTNVVGNFSFGLHKVKERLGLFDAYGASIDSVSYKVPPSDSLFTIGLLLPFLDNGDFDNWEVNLGKGSPERPNPYYLESRIKAEQAQWMKMGLAIGLFLCAFLVLWMRKSFNK